MSSQRTPDLMAPAIGLLLALVWIAGWALFQVLTEQA
jgi:hypothetical protein